MPSPPSPFEVSSNDHNPPHQPTRPMRSRASRRSSDFIPRLLLFLITVFVILSLVTFIAWCVINPINPTFGLTSLYVSNITLSNSQFTANYDIQFALNNTNRKVNLVVDHAKVVVMYDKAVISDRTVDEVMRVEVGKMSKGKLEVALGRKRARSLKDGVFRHISDDWSKKMVSLNVKLFVRARFELGIWPTKQRLLQVSCLLLTVEFLSTKGAGKLMTGGKGCMVQPV